MVAPESMEKSKIGFVFGFCAFEATIGARATSVAPTKKRIKAIS